MDENLYQLIETAESFNALFPIPYSLDDFQQTYERIDVGYDVFYTDAYVCRAYYIVYDEEYFGRDRWGWSAHADYMDTSGDVPCHRTVSGAFKCSSPQEALASLQARLSDC